MVKFTGCKYFRSSDFRNVNNTSTLLATDLHLEGEVGELATSVPVSLLLPEPPFCLQHLPLLFSSQSLLAVLHIFQCSISNYFCRPNAFCLQTLSRELYRVLITLFCYTAVACLTFP